MSGNARDQGIQYDHSGGNEIVTRALGHIAALLAYSALLFAGDPFIGNWKANTDTSQLDPKHSAKQAPMRFVEDAVGYRLTVSGMNGKRHTVSKAILIYIDGKERPAPGEENTVMSATKPDPLTLEMVAKKDGHETGRSSYVISGERKIFTATVAGKDPKGRPFKTVMVFEKEE